MTARADDGAALDGQRIAVLRGLADDADLRELHTEYAADASLAIDALRAAVATGDAGGAIAVVHRLRGSSLTVGASRLAALLEDLERRAAEDVFELPAIPLELIASEVGAATRALALAFSLR
jgi:HPt (histidine-containing phosphotransfer) domain-containing protein